MMKSLLVGNGLDIQVGGDDYLNRWIMVRLLAKAQMGKYDSLFDNIISGEEIVGLFNGMLDIANKTIEGKYTTLINNCPITGLSDELNKAVLDFKSNHGASIKSVDEIGMEDWILLFQVYLLDQEDLLNQYQAVKEGYERMLLDSIFCEGKIQRLQERLSRKAKEYFRGFDNIFSVNYDNLIEKATRCNVYHLHGDFNTLFMTENPKNAIGYFRQKNNMRNIMRGWEHCFSTAILDFSGNLKYKFATQISKCNSDFEKIKKSLHDGKLAKGTFLALVPPEQKVYYELGIEKDLYMGQDYYFDKFENLSGELTIIGLSPFNDSHIFDCINKSEVDVVNFYYFFNNADNSENNSLSLNIRKPYRILNIQDLWNELELYKPHKKLFDITEDQLDFLNTICLSDKITREELLRQVNSIPSATRSIIMEMLNVELNKEKYRAPTNKQKLVAQLKKFGNILSISSLSPQCIYFLWWTSNKQHK